MKETQGELPQPKGWDHAHLAVKAALAALPVVGGPAAELFAAIIAPPLARRRDEWLQSLAEGLEALTDRIPGFDVNSLTDNEAFVSAVMQASRAALQTHQKEKLAALRNSVLNVAAGNAPEEDERAMFLTFIETLTSWHVRVLKFFQDPLSAAQEHRVRTDYMMAGPATPLEDVFPELRGKREFYERIFNDLHYRGLTDVDDKVLHTTMSAGGVFAKRTTALADRFLAFITSPL